MDWSVWYKVQLFVSGDSIFIAFLLTQKRREKIIHDYRFTKLCPLINLNGWKYFQNVMDCFVWIFIWTKNEMPFARLIIVWYLQPLLEATQVFGAMPERFNESASAVFCRSDSVCPFLYTAIMLGMFGLRHKRTCDTTSSLKYSLFVYCLCTLSAGRRGKLALKHETASTSAQKNKVRITSRQTSIRQTLLYSSSCKNSIHNITVEDRQSAVGFLNQFHPGKRKRTTMCFSCLRCLPDIYIEEQSPLRRDQHRLY